MAALSAREGGPIIPAPRLRRDGEEESLDVWGFRDSRFTILPSGHAGFTGSRYPVSGLELPDLLPWIRKTLAIDLTAGDVNPPAAAPEIPAPKKHPDFTLEARAIISPDGLTEDPAVRLRHGHGHTLEEMYLLKHGGFERIPDLVVYPETEEQV